MLRKQNRFAKAICKLEACNLLYVNGNGVKCLWLLEKRYTTAAWKWFLKMLLWYYSCRHMSVLMIRSWEREVSQWYEEDD